MTDFETHPVGTAARIAELTAAQKYRYIGKDGKPVLARDLEDRIEQLEADADMMFAKGMSHGQQVLKDTGRLVIVDSPELNEMREALTRANAARDIAEQERDKLLRDIEMKGGSSSAPTQDAYDAACRAIERHRAATAAAYEAASARLYDAAKMYWQNGAASASAALDNAATSIRALATPDHTAALDRLIAEAEARVWKEAEQIARNTGTCMMPSGHFLSERCADAILAASKKGGA